MSDSFSSAGHSSAVDLTKLIKLVRRICVLRERGETERAARLHADELVSAIAEYRLWHGPDSFTDEKLCVLFVNETEIVREAMALAASVAPDLAALVPAASAPEKPVFQTINGGSLRPFPEQPPAIAELLDAMISAETSERRAPPANRRRS